MNWIFVGLLFLTLIEPDGAGMLELLMNGRSYLVDKRHISGY